MIDVITLQAMIEMLPGEIGRIEEEGIYLRKGLEVEQGRFNMFVAEQRLKMIEVFPKDTMTIINDRITATCEPERLKVIDSKVKVEIKIREMGQKEREFQGAKAILKYKETELRNLGGV